MKNFHFFLLMVMLVAVMVHTATLKCDPLLKDIIHDVQRISSHTLPKLIVGEPSNGLPKCVPDFFCLAKKSLDPIENMGICGINRLHRQINEYITKMNKTECTLSNSEYDISDLLKDIEDCAKHEITNKDANVTIHCKL